MEYKIPDNLPKNCDSIVIAETLLGIDWQTLRRLKANGCPGFRNSKVYPKEVVQYIKTHPGCLDPNYFEKETNTAKGDDSLAEITKENKRLDGELKKLKIQLDKANLEKAKGDYITVQEAKRFLISVGTATDGLYTQAFKDLPVLLEGKTAGQIEEELKKTRMGITRMYSEEFKEWFKKFNKS